MRIFSLNWILGYVGLYLSEKRCLVAWFWWRRDYYGHSIVLYGMLCTVYCMLVLTTTSANTV